MLIALYRKQIQETVITYFLKILAHADGANVVYVHPTVDTKKYFFCITRVGIFFPAKPINENSQASFVFMK
jgi:hypothetical protein